METAAGGALVRTNSYSADIWAPVTDAMVKCSETLQTDILETLQGVSQEELPEALKASNKTIIEGAKTFSNQNSEIMIDLWDQYDTNADGFLSIEELTKMQRHALQKTMDDLPKNIDTALDGFFKGYEIGLRAAVPEDQVVAQLEEMKSQRDAMYEAAKAEALAQLEKTLEPETFAKNIEDLWQAMDTNNDGQVTRDEFINMYLTHQVEIGMKQAYQQLGIDCLPDEEVPETIET